MILKHQHIWSSELGDVNVTKHSIILIQGSRPFKSAPYRFGPKTEECKTTEVDKHLHTGLMEPFQSVWAAPLLFALKKDGRL